MRSRGPGRLLRGAAQAIGYDVALLMCPGHAAGRRRAEGLLSTYVTDPASGAQQFFGGTTPDHWLLGELPKDRNEYLARGQLMIVTVGKQVLD